MKRPHDMTTDINTLYIWQRFIHLQLLSMYSTGITGSGLSGIVQSSSNFSKPTKVTWAEKKTTDDDYRIPSEINEDSVQSTDSIDQETVDSQTDKPEQTKKSQRGRSTTKKQTPKKGSTKKRTIAKRNTRSKTTKTRSKTTTRRR